MRVYLLSILLICTISIYAEDELLRMKNGSTLKGEIINFSKEGILFKVAKLGSTVELKWDSLSEETFSKYKNKIPEEIAEVVPEVSEEENDTPVVKPDVVKKDNPLSDKNITKRLYDKYKAHQKKLIKEYASGNYLAAEEGVVLSLKDNKVVKGKVKREKDGVIELIYNGLALKVNKDDVSSMESIVYTVSKGALEFSNLKDAVKSLHESCIALSSADIGITSEQGAYIWKLRSTGGNLPTSEGEFQFNEYKKMVYIDLGTMSHIFFSKKGKADENALPSHEEWNNFNSSEKSKYFEAILAINGGTNLESIEKPCSMCKGEGKIMVKREDKIGGNDKKFGSKGNGKSGNTEYEKCSQCQGGKKLYSIKFQ